MKQLKMNFENCYGIKKMRHNIDFAGSNVTVIYASNGTMKSSFARTFEAVRDEKNVEEQVFGRQSSYSITDENGADISPESIIVINPFNEKTYEHQGKLMANAGLSSEYIRIHKNIDENKRHLFEQVKTCLGYSQGSPFDVESALLRDWDYSKKDLFLCLEEIRDTLRDPDMECFLEEGELDYNTMFNDKVYAMITTGKTADWIEEYEKKYSELVERSLYMKKGVIDHNSYENIGDALEKNGFFEAGNEIKLNARAGRCFRLMQSKEELDDWIQSEKEKVLNTNELKILFEKINTALSRNTDTQAFNAFLQMHPGIIAEYKNIERFRKKVWIKAFLTVEYDLDQIINEYRKSREEIRELRRKAKNETTDWNLALRLFKERFFVPFTIETANQEDVILNMDMPVFKYIFKDSRGEKEVAQEELLKVLSTGEKRAYYILNLIFQILVAKNQGQEKLIILDDISESFDYKNKYAIVEYISDISEYVDEKGEKLFKIILLTHNFDFYRTVASRVTTRQNAYIAYASRGEIQFEAGQYIKNVFGYYKERMEEGNCDNIIAAALPFVRNLIEYTEGEDSEDYLKLTSLLHYREDTETITMKDIQDIFNAHWCRSSRVHFAKDRGTEPVYDFIMAQADKIDDSERLDIENKMILSMAIRLRAEKYMIRQIGAKVENGSGIIRRVSLMRNQTAWLVKEYKKNINDGAVDILEQTAMLTPENTHLNASLFEPILDVSSMHLYQLYHRIKKRI